MTSRSGRGGAPLSTTTATTARSATTRTIGLELNEFPSIPAPLLDAAANPVDAVTVGVKELFHHYYLAKYGDGAEDRGVYEYEQWLTSGPDWRFRGAGIGADKEAKRNVSNELAKGFARWFLYCHAGFTYFCPLDDLLDHKNSDGTTWTRKSPGDLPDYVCGPNRAEVSLLEAKGRYRSVSFRSKEFGEFREQIQRAQLLDGSGQPLQVKGFIAATRWATADTPRVRSTLLVEDPPTDGRLTGPDGFPPGVGLSMIGGHYGPILQLLQLPLHAEAVRTRRPVPNPTGARRGLWECIAGPLAGRRFVGGILPNGFTHALASEPWCPFLHEPDPRRLGRIAHEASPFVLAPPARFFGLEETVFHQAIAVAREGLEAAARIDPVGVPESTGSLTLLRDGTVAGPVHYFVPVGVVSL